MGILTNIVNEKGNPHKEPTQKSSPTSIPSKPKQPKQPKQPTQKLSPMKQPAPVSSAPPIPKQPKKARQPEPTAIPKKASPVKEPKAIPKKARQPETYTDLRLAARAKVAAVESDLTEYRSRRSVNYGRSNPEIDPKEHPANIEQYGPIMTRSGRIIYYNPSHGNYTDGDTGNVLTWDEWNEADMPNQGADIEGAAPVPEYGLSGMHPQLDKDKKQWSLEMWAGDFESRYAGLTDEANTEHKTKLQNEHPDIYAKAVEMYPDFALEHGSHPFRRDKAVEETDRLKELAGIFRNDTEEVINEEPEPMSVDFNDFMQWFFTEDEDYLSFASEAIQSIKANGFVKYEKIDMFNRAEYVPGRFVTGGDEDGEYHPSELTLRESKELDEIAPLIPLAVGAAAAATGAIAYKAGNLIHKGVSKIKKNLSDYGKATSNPANEETVNEEHDIAILKAVAQQMEADAHTGDFTAIEELLQDIPQENLEAFLSDHRSKNEYPEETVTNEAELPELKRIQNLVKYR